LRSRAILKVFFKKCRCNPSQQSDGPSKMSGASKAAEIIDAIPTAAISPAPVAAKSIDHIKSMAITRFQASTTDILSTTAKAAFKLETKLRSRKRQTDKAASESIPTDQSVNVGETAMHDTKAKSVSSTTAAQACIHHKCAVNRFSVIMLQAEESKKVTSKLHLIDDQQ
jgi:hypothetical protein